ncbi:MAG: UbiA family prenyltransferase [Emcibacteraceae bacterium]|nr:UbiA family prenyltransferase [Emcibacteraceae bacterium]
MNKNIKYIFVDLDGTLIKTDLLFESALKFLKKNPLNLFLLFIWFVQGKATVKHHLARRIDIDVSKLPYETPLLDYIIELKEKGHHLILATAADMHFAMAIANHLDIFDDVIATDAKVNLKGVHKLVALKEYARGADFSYAGDSSADKPIWKEAASNILVNAPKSAIKEAISQGKADKIINTRNCSTAKAFLRAMRPHQWAKNALIFVPLVTSQFYTDIELISNAVLAFICFSFCASGVYFLNDLLDLEADRQHKTKKNRPLAASDLSIPLGVVGAFVLPAIAFTLSVKYLPANFVTVLAVYFLLTNAYSFFIKYISTADVMTLAMLYTSRVVAGSAALYMMPSKWLMAFSIFLFVSLAYLKRYIEISDEKEGGSNAHSRGYSFADCETMFSLGIANITASVVILALYVNSEEIITQFKTPEILWALCMLLLYWGNRIWVGARRGKIADDPVVFAIKDKVSRMLLLSFVGVILAADLIEF